MVPPLPVEIDWGHPLSVGLIGLYIPSRGGADLAGNGPPIFPQSATTFAPSGVGPGASSLTNTSGMASAAIPTRFQRATTNLGLVHVGWHTATTQGSTSESCIFGMTFSGATYLPFTITTNAGNFHFCTNAGSNFATYSLGVGATLGLNIVAVSNYTGGGNTLYAYKNGASLIAGGTTTAGNVAWAGGPNCKVDMCYSQWTPSTLWENCISLAGMFYDFGASPMSASLAAWQGAEPFAMLRPIVRRTFVTVPATASAARARAIIMA